MSESADFQMREFSLQVFCGGFVEIEKLLARALPHHFIFGLVPDFPILDIVFNAVCPTLCVVFDYALADFRPFEVVFGREYAVCLDVVVVFDCDAQAVEDFCIGFFKPFEVGVGKGEVV